jgi:glutamate racemase
MTRQGPDEPFIYLADSGRFPYGPRPLDQVKEFTTQAVHFFLRHHVKLIVLACNTATAAGLGEARRISPVPVVGVIGPGARAAVAAHDHRGKLAILGTKATIESGAYVKALRGLGYDGEPAGLACPDFVMAAENGDVEGPDVETMAATVLAPLVWQRPSTVILGCTHFAPLSRSISKAFGPDVMIIDPAEETAREVLGTLRQKGLEAPPSARGPRHLYFTSGDPERFRTIGGRLVGRPISEAQLVDLNEF